MTYLGYEIVTANHLHYYILYIFNASLYSKNHLVYIIYVNPYNHVILNYTASVSFATIFAIINGSPTTYMIANSTIPAIEFHNDNETIITSINHVILEKDSNNETIRLVFANYSGIANQTFPDLNKLAGRADLFQISYDLLLPSIVLTILLYLILRRLK